MFKKILISCAASAFVLGIGATAAATSEGDDNNDDHKVTICHRTDSVTNPYNQQSVDADSADGDTGNDNGQGDHSEHTGPVATSQTFAQQLKDNKQNWGDIIPPHDNYGGLNWSTEGQAVYNNGCNYVTGGQGGGTTTTTTTTPSTPVATNAAVLPNTGSSALNTIVPAAVIGVSTVAMLSLTGTRVAARFLK